MTSESSKQKVEKILDVFPGVSKDTIEKVLQYYEDDVNEAMDALTRDFGYKALASLADTGGMKSKVLFRKIQDILNELTPKKLQTVVKQVKELPINNMEKLEGTVNLIFEKAVHEPNCSRLYANICSQLFSMKVSLEGGQGVVNFRKLLLTKCQKEFKEIKSGEKIRVKKMNEIKNAKVEEKYKELQLEIDEKEKKMRWRRLGNIIFIGELFKVNPVLRCIIHVCIQELLDNGNEESLECLCLLLKNVSKELSKQSEDTMMDSYFDSMQKIVDKGLTSSRIRFMLQDVIDLKKYQQQRYSTPPYGIINPPTQIYPNYWNVNNTPHGSANGYYQPHQLSTYPINSQQVNSAEQPPAPSTQQAKKRLIIIHPDTGKDIFEDLNEETPPPPPAKEESQFLGWQLCSSNANLEVEEENSFTENTNGQSVVVLDSTWTLAAELSIKPISTKEQEITWNISSFLKKFWRERKKIASPKYSFANATWQFCFSMDSKKNHSLFAINILTDSSSDPECDCYCSISFLDVLFRDVKNIKCDFKCESAHWTVTNFLSSSEIDNFEGAGAKIVCRISVKDSSIKEACSQNEISYFTHSAVETQLPEKAELPMPSFDYKVLQDFKNLLLNGEGSDVTLQVQDQQFKAHRSFLMARSSVFAAMFNCDMKEKATGIVNVKDCELSSFPVFLEYLYCGSTEKLSSENVFNLYVSADKYDVQDLKRKCLEFMKRNLSVNIFCETLQIALQHSETDLLKLATEFFIRNVQDIILTTKWQSFIVENPIQGNELFIKATKTFR